MIYKNMFLCALAVLIPITSYTNDNSARIKGLKEARFEKTLEISELGIEIEEKYELMHSIFISAGNSVSEEARIKEISTEETKKLFKTINENLLVLEKSIDQMLVNRENILHRLTPIFLQKTDRSFSDFNLAKFYVIRTIMEYDILETLLNQYEVLVQELIEIDRELDSLMEQAAS